MSEPDWWSLSSKEKAEVSRKAAALSRKAGHHLDADAYLTAAQAYEDEIAGIKRCVCGRVLNRRKSSSDSGQGDE
jgi:hypothetical protein